jgi:hypothetical protein
VSPNSHMSPNSHLVHLAHSVSASSTVLSRDHCRCSCHTNPNVVHAFPCCIEPLVSDNLARFEWVPPSQNKAAPRFWKILHSGLQNVQKVVDELVIEAEKRLG